MENLAIDTMLIFDLHMIHKSMNNNYRSDRFEMQRSEDDLSKVLVELTEVFTQSSRVFA